MMRGCARAAILTGLTLIGLTLPRALAAAPGVKAEALVLVNSASPAYRDFEHMVKPYLDNFGVPYATLDITTSPVPSAIDDYALIIVGHRQLDTAGHYLDRGEQEAIARSVYAGSGLVNFDSDLWTNGISRYQFVQDVFEFAPRAETYVTGVVFPAADRAGAMHYITSAHQPGEVLKTGRMRLSGFSLPRVTARRRLLSPNFAHTSCSL